VCTRLDQVCANVNILSIVILKNKVSLRRQWDDLQCNATSIESWKQQNLRCVLHLFAVSWYYNTNTHARCLLDYKWIVVSFRVVLSFIGHQLSTTIASFPNLLHNLNVPELLPHWFQLPRPQHFYFYLIVIGFFSHLIMLNSWWNL